MSSVYFELDIFCLLICGQSLTNSTLPLERLDGYDHVNHIKLLRFKPRIGRKLKTYNIRQQPHRFADLTVNSH
jgi:hypothetical protein